VGVSVADIMHASKTTRYAVGIEGNPAGSGDPSPVTAEGVFRGIKTSVRHGLGAQDVSGLTIAIQGVGHVGAILADKLHAAGAKLIIADVNQDALRQVADKTGAQIVSPDDIYDAEAEVFAPCALGGAINADSLSRLKARVIAGGANNQLASPEMGRVLFERGLTYAPDYVINGGGIINVASEVHGLQKNHAHNPEWVEGKLSRLMETLDEVLARSKSERRPTHEIADEIAEARIRAARA
jgi:leucine dehydrogenase